MNVYKRMKSELKEKKDHILLVDGLVGVGGGRKSFHVGRGMYGRMSGAYAYLL